MTVPARRLVNGFGEGLRQGESSLVKPSFCKQLWSFSQVHPLPSGPVSGPGLLTLLLITGLFLPPPGHRTTLPVVLCRRIYPWFSLPEDLRGWICYALIN